jgi:D-xylose transport system ATP-binding protein
VAAVKVPLVELRGAGKRFGGVHAVEEVSLELHAGRILALVGHNGAGKSTLVRVLSGALGLDAGALRVGGESAHFASPRDARSRGIETVHQALALAENLDAVANLFLGREIAKRWGALDEPAMERAARDVIARLNPAFARFRVPVRELSGGERQTLAVARAVLFRARVLILDEPTAALGPEEAGAVRALVRRLAAENLAILLVSHDLHDVFDLADRIAVMRRGRLVGVRRTREVTHDEVLGMILGAVPLASAAGSLRGDPT